VRNALKHTRIIAGLWLLTTVWPVVFLPLHFLLIKHYSCSLHAEKQGDSYSEEESSCAVCSFDFCWKFSDPEKIVLHREDILLFVKSEPFVAFHYPVWQHHIQLRGPPAFS
jgi:hypothetical protein